MSRHRQKPRPKVPRLDTLRRRGLRLGAVYAANVAVDRIRTVRNRERGLSKWEQGLAEQTFRWIAGGWSAGVVPSGGGA